MGRQLYDDPWYPNLGVWKKSDCPHCGSKNTGAWGPDADKCFDCEMTWDV